MPFEVHKTLNPQSEQCAHNLSEQPLHNPHAQPSHAAAHKHARAPAHNLSAQPGAHNEEHTLTTRSAQPPRTRRNAQQRNTILEIDREINRERERDRQTDRQTDRVLEIRVSC